MTVLAWSAPFLALGSVTAIALSFRAGHDQPVRYAVLRARWAWRCRGRPPVPERGEGRLTREEAQILGNLEAGRDVRTRT